MSEEACPRCKALELELRQIRAADKPNNCFLGWCNAHQIVTLDEGIEDKTDHYYTTRGIRTGFICQVTKLGLTFAEVTDIAQLKDPWNIPQQFLSWDRISRVTPYKKEDS